MQAGSTSVLIFGYYNPVLTTLDIFSNGRLKVVAVSKLTLQAK